MAIREWNLSPADGQSLRLFGSALCQKAEIEPTISAVGGVAGANGNDSAMAWGLGYGGVYRVGDVEMSLAGYHGEVLGTAVMLDGNALDACGHEKDHSSWYAQMRYGSTPRVGLGFAWGETQAEEYAFDRAVSAFKGTSGVEEQSNYGLMLWRHLNDHVTLMAQYTDARTEYTLWQRKTPAANEPAVVAGCDIQLVSRH